MTSPIPTEGAHHERPRRMPRRLGVLALAGLLAVVAAPAGPAAADNTYWIPVDERVVVDGRGYGHGRGMSQYGAQGAALGGLTWQQILAFYYPGTQLGSSGGRMRVLITGDTSRDLQVSHTSALYLRDLGNGNTWLLDPPTPGTDRWKLDVLSGTNRLGVWFHDGAGWHRWGGVPGDGTLAGEGQFDGPGALTLWLPGGRTDRYHGVLRTAKPAAGSTDRNTVNDTTLESYVKGVVASEMPARWDPDAVRAQAVAARTYAVRHRNAHPNRYFHVDDTTAYQVYGGVDAEHPDSNAAVTATSGRVVTYNGSPALTEFSSSSGGWSAGSSLPYQKVKPDPYDGWSGNPNHFWSEVIDTQRLESRYPSLGNLERIVVTERNNAGAWDGRVERAELIGTRDRVAVTGNSLRSIFGLRSTWFHAESPRIIRYWRSLGGAGSVVGSPLHAEYSVGSGVGQAFERGRIYWHGATGAHEVHGGILTSYRNLRGPRGLLGFPSSDELDSAGGGAVSHFQNGRIYYFPGLGSNEVHGGILTSYLHFGGPGGFLGYPTTHELDSAGGGAASHFQNGRIFYYPGLGSNEVHGGILTSYLHFGGPGGFLGYPTTHELDSAGGGAASHFQNGRIYYYPGLGSNEVHGGILDRYLETGGPAGPLGYPTTHELDTAEGAVSHFQNGRIEWNRTTGTTTVHLT